MAAAAGTLDFRRADPASFQFVGRPRGNPAVQTPACECRVSFAGPGMFRVDMRLRHDVAVHAAFADWVARVEDAASAARAGAGGSRSRGVYNGNFRLMAFNDTLAFGPDGQLSADLLDARGCSAIVQPTGLWAAGDRWGVRWKVQQIKFDRVPPELPVAPAPAGGPGPAPRAPDEYDFVPDE